MSHKTLVKIAIVMIVVFGIIVMIYPQIYSPQPPLPVEPQALPADSAPVTE